MAIYFSGDDIIDMAVQTEETGCDFYRVAQSQAKSQKLKSLFQYLAEEEKKHKEAYEGLRGQITEKAVGTAVDWDELGLYIKAMTDSSFFVGEKKNIDFAARAKDEKEAVDFAMDFEKDTLLFFYQIRDLVKASGKAVVDAIIEAEKEHIRKLSEVKSTL